MEKKVYRKSTDKYFFRILLAFRIKILTRQGKTQ